MKIAYADPPYLGCGNYYPEHEEIDHMKLIEDLMWNYSAWALSCSSPSLGQLLSHPLLKDSQGVVGGMVRVAAWVKPFCSFKPNVNPGYAWEPVIFRPAGRGRFPRQQPTIRDWVAGNITLRKGLVGAKPPAFCYWLFELLGARENDEFFDLYPGTGIVTKCWQSWCEAKRCSQEVMELNL
jgi:hypothetical protein